MYSYIKGLIVDIQSDHIVLENNGIGYLIYVSNPYAFSKGKEVVVYLYQQVKEDGILLYGFNLKEEKDRYQAALDSTQGKKVGDALESLYAPEDIPRAGASVRATKIRAAMQNAINSGVYKPE